MPEERMCARCAENPAQNCGYLEKEETDAGIEYDCNFWWEDTVYKDPPDCDDCPLLLCSPCKDEIVANTIKFVRICTIPKS
jgi:hypothetical protein